MAALAKPMIVELILHKFHLFILFKSGIALNAASSGPWE